MNDSFDKRQADYYFRQCAAHFPMKDSKVIDYPHDYLAEKNAPYHYRFQPEHVCPSSLTGPHLENALNTSFESPSLFPNDLTYYVMDISEYKETSFNTIMYQLNESPKKSIETTTVIMNRYFESKKFPYSYMKKFGETIGYKRVLPYVFGDIHFVPDRGATKQTASWYALHHFTHFDFNIEDKRLVFFSESYPLVTLEMTKSVFEKQLNVVSHLYYIQKKVIECLLINLNIRETLKRRNNIVHKRLQSMSYQIPPFSAHEYLQFLIYFQAEQMIASIFGEDDPYLEEIRAKFSFPHLNAKSQEYL
ncbi:MAG: hypothetical protein JJU16_11465 [Alkalibacterium sp.]|nr:hypothetical protein [Alkalibacterium sp.]